MTAAIPCWAVHISDGVLEPTWEYAGFATAALLMTWSAWRIHEDEIPRVGVMTAAFFVASQVHLPLGGASVHLLLNGLVGVILGRRAAVAIAVGLFLQALLFAHGGVMPFGVNVTVYAIPGLFAGWAFPRLRRTGRFRDGILGAGLGLVTGLLTTSLVCAVLWFGGRAEWTTLVTLVFLANLPVVAVEAVACGTILAYLGRVKPEMLRG